MRPSKDEWAMVLAAVTSQRSTCLKRQVGCVLLSPRGHVLSTGYNGVATGQPHCNEMVMAGADYRVVGRNPLVEMPRRMVESFPHACSGAKLPPGSRGQCQALHAEWNALLQCRDAHAIGTCYVTTAPCETCVKMLLGTSCERVAFLDLHDDVEPAEQLWSGAGRAWQQLPRTPFVEAHLGTYRGFLTRPSLP